MLTQTTGTALQPRRLRLTLPPPPAALHSRLQVAWRLQLLPPVSLLSLFVPVQATSTHFRKGCLRRKPLWPMVMLFELTRHSRRCRAATCTDFAANPSGAYLFLALFGKGRLPRSAQAAAS